MRAQNFYFSYTLFEGLNLLQLFGKVLKRSTCNSVSSRTREEEMRVMSSSRCTVVGNWARSCVGSSFELDALAKVLAKTSLTAISKQKKTVVLNTKSFSYRYSLATNKV